jgi:hypothetical protein
LFYLKERKVQHLVYSEIEIVDPFHSSSSFSCFLGEDAINWLIKMMKDDGQELTTSDACILANSMINAGMDFSVCVGILLGYA